MPRPSPKLPECISIKDVTAMLGDEWDVKRARQYFQRHGALVKRGGRWFATPESLRSAFPEVWEEYMRRLEAAEEAESNTPRTAWAHSLF
jgi:hypothetical protein